MTTTQIPPGTYRIVVAHGVGVASAEVAELGCEAECVPKPRAPKYLTNAKWVTIEHARGAQPDSEQEWRLVHRNQDWIIELNSKAFPPKYITYNGAPGKPKEGARVELHISGFPGPLSAWHFKPAPKAENTYSIVVSGSEISEQFGIAIDPHKGTPPHLELSSDPNKHLEWKFENAPL